MSSKGEPVPVRDWLALTRHQGTQEENPGLLAAGTRCRRVADVVVAVRVQPSRPSLQRSGPWILHIVKQELLWLRLDVPFNPAANAKRYMDDA